MVVGRRAGGGGSTQAAVAACLHTLDLRLDAPLAPLVRLGGAPLGALHAAPRARLGLLQFDLTHAMLVEQLTQLYHLGVQLGVLRPQLHDLGLGRDEGAGRQTAHACRDEAEHIALARE